MMNHDSAPAATNPKSPVVTWGVIALCAVVALVWVLFLRPRLIAQRAIGHPAVGQPLMVLELQPLTSTERAISHDNLRGKVTLLNFWGTWCPPCVLEFPHLVELWDRYRGQADFQLLSVSSTFDLQEDVPSVRAETEQFLKQRGTNLPTYIDATGVTRQLLAEQLGGDGFGYPTTLLVDRAGSIRAVWIGYERGYELQMEQLVSRLLAEK